MSDTATSLQGDPVLVALARLRDQASDGPTEGLVTLWLEDLLARPVAELLPPAATAALLRDALRTAIASAALQARAAAEAEAIARRLDGRQGPLGASLSPPAVAALRALVSRPYTPDRALVLALLDREPVRRLLRELLVQTLIAFGHKLAHPLDSGLARGLGGLSRFAAGQVKALGALASGVASAVGGELERQLEQRSAEFADAALAKVLQRLADHLCDPAHRAEQAALRQAILDGVLELRGPQLATELRRTDPDETLRIARSALTHWLDDERSLADLERAVSYAATLAGATPLGELLAALGLADAARRLARPLLLARLRPFFASEAFAAWLAALLAPAAAKVA